MHRWLRCALAAGLLLAACGRPTAAPPAATAVNTGSAASTVGTAAKIGAASTAAPSPSAKPLRPTPTSARTATPTPAPTPMPTATPNAVATAAAVSALFPDTGYDFSYRPVAYQIDNAPAARPQTGLSRAYVVYETIAEGGVTRYTAIFVRKEEPKIGNLRSARLVDLDVLPQWDALLAHVGASTPVMNLLWTSGISWLNLDDPTLKKWSWRTDDRVAPYNLYSSLDLIRQLAQSKNLPVTTATPRYFPVGPQLNAGSSPATIVDIPYDAPGQVRYVYVPEAGSYQRFLGGRPHVDALDGRQLLVKTVVVQFAVPKETDIIEDEEGSRSLQFQLHGSGKALVLRGGGSFAATWHADMPDRLTTFTDSDGKPIPFAPGNVWIEIVPADMSVTVR